MYIWSFRTSIKFVINCKAKLILTSISIFDLLLILTYTLVDTYTILYIQIMVKAVTVVIVMKVSFRTITKIILFVDQGYSD